MELRGETRDDKFLLVCEKCSSPASCEYVGAVRGVGMMFRAECATCKDSGQWSFAGWRGLPLGRSDGN